MTKEEIKEYIKNHNNPEEALQVVKDMAKEGVEISAESLDARLKPAEAERAVEEFIEVEEPLEEPEELPIEEPVAEEHAKDSKLLGPMVFLSVISMVMMIVGMVFSEWGSVNGVTTVIRYNPLYYVGTVAMLVVNVVSAWKMYTKAGEKGWASLIPFYNSWVLYRMLFGRGSAMFRLLIPFYNIYWAIKTYIVLGKSFGKKTGFIFGLIFLSSIFQTIIAFDSSTYRRCEK